MRTIWKYQLLPPRDADGTRLGASDRVAIDMPRGARVLCVQVQYGAPCLWAEVHTDRTIERRHFVIAGTGNEMPDGADAYVDTWQELGGARVFHLYETHTQGNG